MEQVRRNDASRDHDIEFLWLEQIGHIAMGRNVEMTASEIGGALGLPEWFVRERIKALVRTYDRIRADAEHRLRRLEHDTKQLMDVSAEQCGLDVAMVAHCDADDGGNAQNRAAHIRARAAVDNYGHLKKYPEYVRRETSFLAADSPIDRREGS